MKWIFSIHLVFLAKTLPPDFLLYARVAKPRWNAFEIFFLTRTTLEQATHKWAKQQMSKMQVRRGSANSRAGRTLAAGFQQWGRGRIRGGRRPNTAKMGRTIERKKRRRRSTRGWGHILKCQWQAHWRRPTQEACPRRGVYLLLFVSPVKKSTMGSNWKLCFSTTISNNAVSL